MKTDQIQINSATKPRQYSFQNIIRFKSPRFKYVNDVHQQMEINLLQYSNDAECTYELKFSNRSQSYKEKLEAITPLFYEKVYPIVRLKVNSKGQIIKLLNYNDIVYNWSKNKKEIVKKLEKDWMSVNAINGLEQLMFDEEAFLQTFARKPEIKLLFPHVYDFSNGTNKQYEKTEFCDELAADIEIPLKVSYKLSATEQKSPLFKFIGKLDNDKFQEEKENRKKTEAQKLKELVRTFSNNINATYKPLIKQTGFYNLDDTALVKKSLEAISFKIPDFVYQDRITSLTLKN